MVTLMILQYNLKPSIANNVNLLRKSVSTIPPERHSESLDNSFTGMLHNQEGNYGNKCMNVDASSPGLITNALDVGLSFNYEQAFMEAALSIGDQDQSVQPPDPAHSYVNTMLSICTPPGISPTLSYTNGMLSAPTHPEPNAPFHSNFKTLAGLSSGSSTVIHQWYAQCANPSRTQCSFPFQL